jgi:hypothetical protein
MEYKEINTINELLRNNGISEAGVTAFFNLIKKSYHINSNEELEEKLADPEIKDSVTKLLKSFT